MVSFGVLKTKGSTQPSRHALRVVLPALALAALTGAAPASASVTATSISSPADHSYLTWNAKADTSVTVTGTAHGASNGDKVDINCYYEDGTGAVTDEHLATGVSVQNQAFTTTGSLYPIKDTTCRLRAVPASTAPTDLSPFAGPAVAVSEVESGNYDNSGANHGASNSYQIIGGPNAGKLYDYYIYDSQLAGANDYLSLSSCGLCDSHAIDPSTFRVPSSQMFNSNAALYKHVHNAPSEPDRSYIQIDGANAYSSNAAQQLYSRSAPTTFDGSQDAAHFPTLTLTDTIDPATGALTIHENEDFVRCATPTGTADPAPDSANHTNCPGFAATGVHFARTMVQNQAGRVVTVSDTFSSTDGRSHRLDMLDFQSVNGTSGTEFDFPWFAGGFQPFVAGEFVPAAPAGAPVQIYTAQDASKADGDQSVARGAITLSAPPSGAIFEPDNTFDLAYQPLVPAHGSWTLTQTFSTAFLQADVQTLSNAAAAAMKPSLSITSPHRGAKVSSQPLAVSGTVSAGGNGLPASVQVNGVSIPLSKAGAFSARVPLAPGANTITATSTDAGGLSATSSVPVSYQPPPPSSSARITQVTQRGNRLEVTLSCSAGARCSGNAGVVATLTSHHHPRQITVASGRFSVPGGATRTFTLKLSGATKRALRSVRRLPATLALTLTEPGNARSSLTKSVVLRGK